MILDHNGHAVPDGTPVTFRAFYVEEQLERRVEAVTVEGVAVATIPLELAGQIEIRDRRAANPAIAVKTDALRALRVYVTVPSDRRAGLTGGSTPFRITVTNVGTGKIITKNVTFKGPSK